MDNPETTHDKNNDDNMKDNIINKKQQQQRQPDQLFPNGKRVTLMLKFGESIVYIPLIGYVTDSSRQRADLTVRVNNMKMLSLYFNIYEAIQPDPNKSTKWICKELPELRELTVNWNSIMINMISKTREEYDDMDNLLDPSSELIYTKKWRKIKVPDQSLKTLRLSMKDNRTLRPNYELRYVIPELINTQIETASDEDDDNNSKVTMEDSDIHDTIDNNDNFNDENDNKGTEQQPQQQRQQGQLKETVLKLSKSISLVSLNEDY